MRVIWTDGAAEDLRGIVEHIRQDREDAARNFAKVVFERVMSLSSTPYRGRKRMSDDARELLFAPWPYVAIYEVVDDQVFVEGIMHTARDRSA